MSVVLMTAIFGALALGQDSPIRLCTESACDNCPNSLTTAGTGYPSCVIYDRDTVLGGTVDQYEMAPADTRKIFYDIAPQGNPQCRTIIRSPASVDDPNCGAPIYSGSGGICFSPIDPPGTKTTFMIQFCCGFGDCSAAGAQKRADGSGSFSSAVFRDSLGNLVVPNAVGDGSVDKMDLFMEDHGLNSSSVARTLSESGVPIFKIGYVDEPLTQKRACDTYTETRGQYTKSAGTSERVSGEICGSTTEVMITNEKSVSRSTTFGASVGDPFGIVSASIDFTTEESASQSYTYTFSPAEGQCGFVSWTAELLCTEGTITGCEGGDQTGEVCTARRINDNQLAGVYSFVQAN